MNKTLILPKKDSLSARGPLLSACATALLTLALSASVSAQDAADAVEATATDEAEASVAVPKSIDEADGVADDDTTEAAEPEAGEGEPSDESWRVSKEQAAEPPVQVRRAVEQVHGTAARVAASIAGVDAPAEQAEPSEAQADAGDADETGSPHTRALQRHLHSSKAKLAELGVVVDFSTIRRFADRLLESDRPDQLVLGAYVRDPRWVEAMKLLKEDECDEALELATAVLGEPEKHVDGEPAIRYAFGRIQMCSTKHQAEGRKTLEELADSAEGAVAILAKRRLGLPDGKDSSKTDDGLYLNERIGLAKKRARKGEVDEALQDLDTLHDEMTRSWHQYKVRSAQVDILAANGRLKEAARVMLGIYRIARDWKIGDHVEAKLENLQRRAGVEVLSFGERVDRMRDLIARGKYRKAREVSVENAKLRGVGGSEIRGWSFYRRALQAERKRDREGAAEMFEKAEKLVEDKAIRPRLYFGWARALRRLDRDREAIALYDRICEEYPRHHLCDDSLFEAGRLSQYLEMHHQAREKFALVVGLHPYSEHVPQALWRGAFSAYLMGDYEDAQSPLEHIIAHYGDVQDASELTLGLKAQYWLGAAKMKAGDKKGAVEELQATVDRGPLTWYGRLAVARMEEAGMSARLDVPRSSLSATDLRDLGTLRVPEHSRLSVAAEYCRLGLYEDAIDELRKQVAIYPVPERAHQMLAAVYLANGEPNYAHWIMKKHIPEAGPDYATLRDWGVAFPVDYMDLSHRWGEKHGVSPFLVQAIIRQESGFRAGVSSYAGAMGLMQLMPGTARYTQRNFIGQGGHLSRSQIVDPETNIKLGSMYIRVHTSFAADQIPLALAGYNAGPAPLESWFGRYGKREVDAWVESITYREARGYVRKVFTSYVTYAALYGDGDLPDIDLKMPATLREWGDVPEIERIEEGEPVSMLRD